MLLGDIDLFIGGGVGLRLEVVMGLWRDRVAISPQIDWVLEGAAPRIAGSRSGSDE
jgi:hypothetical protein